MRMVSMLRMLHRLPAALCSALLACAGTAAQAGTLYDDLGGDAGVTAIVDQFLWNLADSEKVQHHFIDSNLERLRAKLTEYICQVAEGPCAYTGDTMERTHRNHDITVADFNVTVDCLIDAMESQNVPTGVQNRLLKQLATDYDAVVQR